jgi:hypothetical protein
VAKWRSASTTCTARMRIVGCRRFDRSKRFAAATRSFAMNDVPERPLDRKLMAPSGQFCTTNRVPRCEQSRRRWQSRQRQFVPIEPRLHIRWISELRRTRVTMCLQLFRKLRPHAHKNWHYLVTGEGGGSITNTFGVKYGARKTRIDRKWRTEPLRRGKAC